MWKEAPDDDSVKTRVLEFFDALPSSLERAFALVAVAPQKGQTEEETRESILRWLWDDMEDWWEDLEDPSFEGPWRSHLTPLRQVTEDTLGWDLEGEAGDQTLLVSVHCFEGEPTDDTARFSVRKTSDGYALYLEQIHIM